MCIIKCVFFHLFYFFFIFNFSFFIFCFWFCCLLFRLLLENWNENICQQYLLNSYRILYHDICYNYRPLSVLVYIGKCTISAYIYAYKYVCIFLSVHVLTKMYRLPFVERRVDYTNRQTLLLNAFHILHICLSTHK